MFSDIYLFSSASFFIWFFFVYVIYLALNHRWQNRLLLVASYFFYGSWDWRFLGLLMISTVVDYIAGLKIGNGTNGERQRRFYLIVSLCTNLGILACFKYFNFFASSLEDLFGIFGWGMNPLMISVVLPVGISFYTFQTMSYTIDIYRKKLKPTKSIVDFALFVSFFPQLVAGPIERARRLLPQIQKQRHITDKKIRLGTYLLTWGLFKKIVVADSLAALVDPVFGGQEPYEGMVVILAVYAFAWQIYADFSGYSDMARGLAYLLGFKLMVNFRLPYVASNPREFWQRWHISLSSWLRDYLYIPIGGNKKGKWRTLINIMTTMLLGGLWHGAAWTFVVWGAYHGAWLVLYNKYRDYIGNRQVKNRIMAHIWKGVAIVATWNLVCLGWLFFRAESFEQILAMVKSILFNFNISSDVDSILGVGVFSVALLIMVQIMQWRSGDLLYVMNLKGASKGIFLLMVVFVALYISVYTKGVANRPFIYFQF